MTMCGFIILLTVLPCDSSETVNEHAQPALAPVPRGILVLLVDRGQTAVHDLELCIPVSHSTAERTDVGPELFSLRF